MIKVIVDRDLCIGCALCTFLADGVFEMDDDKAKPQRKIGMSRTNNLKAAKEAEKSCPVGAISVAVQ